MLDQQQMSLISDVPFLGMKLHLNWDLKFPFEKCRRCNRGWFPSDYRFAAGSSCNETNRNRTSHYFY